MAEWETPKMSKLRRFALCPQCGEPMRYDNRMKAWDCGPESEGKHGFWDKEVNEFEYIWKEIP